jgi:hypothetical protein
MTDDADSFELSLPAFVLARRPDVRVTNGQLEWSPTAEFHVVENEEFRGIAVYSDVYAAANAIIDRGWVGQTSIIKIDDARVLAQVVNAIARETPGKSVGWWIDQKWFIDPRDFEGLE